MAYNVTSGSVAFALNSNAAAGTWNLCYKLKANNAHYSQTQAGLWTLVTGKQLIVIARPTSTPPIGIAGSVTPLTFVNASNGDSVVLQQTNCSNAHAASTGVGALAAGTLGGLPTGAGARTFVGELLGASLARRSSALFC